jgi:hypothetical protein
MEELLSSFNVLIDRSEVLPEDDIVASRIV